MIEQDFLKKQYFYEEGMVDLLQFDPHIQCIFEKEKKALMR